MDQTLTNLAELAKTNDDRAHEFSKQLALWLGIGSAAGAVTMVSFAGQLPDKQYALQLVLPSLWLFLLGVSAAGLSLFFQSRELSQVASHYANSHNRESYKSLIETTTRMTSAPHSVASKHNAPRDALISKHDEQHAAAESAWKVSRTWARSRMVATGLSAAAFLTGFGWPLTMFTLGKPLVPLILR